MGYLFTFILECVGGFTGLAISVGINCMYFSICWYVEGLMNDIMWSLKELDTLTGPQAKLNKFRERFREAIEFHYDTIE